jgi:hypothetical protein
MPISQIVTNSIADDVTVKFADGSAAAPSLTNTGDTNTGIFFPAADTIAFSEGGVESMRIDSVGNVGIGTNSPGQKLVVQDASASRVDIVRTSGATARISATSDTGFLGTTTNHPLVMFTNDAERMRIDASGNLLVGTQTQLLSGSHSFVNSGNLGILSLRNGGSTSGRYFGIGPDVNNNCIVYNQAQIGVFLANGGTSWTANSDERLKTDLLPISDAANKVSTLRAVTGRYKTDDENTSRAFLIAQDVQKVLPEAVNANDPEKLGVQYTDVIPLLVAAIKELNAKVTELEAKLASK